MKIQYYSHLLLNTKWKIILFLLFYIILIKLHYIEFYNTADCMMKSFTIPRNQYEYERLIKTETEIDFKEMENRILDLEERTLKEFLIEQKKTYIYKSYIAKINTIGDVPYRIEAGNALTIYNKINPYLEHIIEHKQNHKNLIQKSIELEQTITNLVNKQKPYQETIQRMQAQDIYKIKNIIYDFLPLREENQTLQQHINTLEAQKFSLELKNKQLLHNYKELNQQSISKEILIRELQSERIATLASTDVTQQLNELRTNLQNLTERLNTQENNIHNRPDISTGINTNNCVIN